MIFKTHTHTGVESIFYHSGSVCNRAQSGSSSLHNQAEVGLYCHCHTEGPNCISFLIRLFTLLLEDVKKHCSSGTVRESVAIGRVGVVRM